MMGIAVIILLIALLILFFYHQEKKKRLVSERRLQAEQAGEEARRPAFISQEAPDLRFAEKGAERWLALSAFYGKQYVHQTGL